MNKIQRHTENSTKKPLSVNISKRLLEFEFKTIHPIKLRGLKYSLKKYCRHYNRCTIIV